MERVTHAVRLHAAGRRAASFVRHLRQAGWDQITRWQKRLIPSHPPPHSSTPPLSRTVSPKPFRIDQASKAQAALTCRLPIRRLFLPGPTRGCMVHCGDSPIERHLFSYHPFCLVVALSLTTEPTLATACIQSNSLGQSSRIALLVNGVGLRRQLV